jgi:alpha-L-fucosidase
MPSPVRWVGSESGLAPYPCWSTCSYASYGAGDPNAGTWFPAETDFTLQNGDNWFHANSGVHTPAELRNMYETSTGSNTALIIDIAPFANGSVPEEQVQAAQTLGDFIRGCYQAQPVATGSGLGVWNVTIAPPQPAAVDRLVVREDQMTGGQRIRGYSISAQLPNGTVVPLAAGSSIGNKRINVLSAPVTVSSLTLTITIARDTPLISAFSAYSCSSLERELDERWDRWARESGYVAPEAGTVKEPSTLEERLEKRPWAKRA